MSAFLAGLLVSSMAAGVLTAGAMVTTAVLEERAARNDPDQVFATAWTGEHENELRQMLREQRDDRRRCPNPDCGGLHCYSWRELGRGCDEEPVEAPETGRLVGKHGEHTVKRVSQNWWPLPQTRFARVRPALWAQVADHAKISLRRPVGTILP